MKPVLLAASLAVAALLTAPNAAATPEQDQQFANILYSEGIVPGPNYVSVAQRVCSHVWQGYSADDAVDVIYRDNDLTYDGAQTYVAAAIFVYCPPVDTRSTLA